MKWRNERTNGELVLEAKEEESQRGEAKGMARCSSEESELDSAHNDVSPTVSQGQRQRRAVSV